MSKGFIWFALNNKKTNYVTLSERLGASIKKHNKNNKTCIITDNHMLQIPGAVKNIDHVELIKENTNPQEEWNLSNEWQVFNLTPFTHTIKLEADMLLDCNIDHWWYHLHQHNMVFSWNCRNFQDDIVTDTPYRKLFKQNALPNIYSGLTYFRKSIFAEKFYQLCRHITKNWNKVQETCLVNCHDKQPTTDVVYALALKIMDPTNDKKIDYDFFKFVHNKKAVNKITKPIDTNDYLYPMIVDNKLYVGGYKMNRLWHYHDKNVPEDLDARIF